MVWDERKLKSGVAWKTELPEVLASTKVAMMIVSDLFLESDFITRARLPALLEKERESGLEICWVLAGQCLFELAGLKESDAGNRVGSAFDGLGLAQRDAAVAEIAKKVAGYLGVEAIAPAAEATPKKPLLPSAIPQVLEPKPVRKRKRPTGPKEAEKQQDSLLTKEIPAPALMPAPSPVIVAPTALTSPLAPFAPVEKIAPPEPPAPVSAKEKEPAPFIVRVKEKAPAVVPATNFSDVPPIPPNATTAASTSPAPAPKTPVVKEIPPAPAEPALLDNIPPLSTRERSLDTMIQVRQATVVRLSKLGSWLIIFAASFAFAALVVLFLQSIEHFLFVIGFAIFAAGLGMWLQARSRFMGQELVGMRYTSSGLADEFLPTRQRETLIRKADEYLAQN